VGSSNRPEAEGDAKHRCEEVLCVCGGHARKEVKVMGQMGQELSVIAQTEVCTCGCCGPTTGAV